MQLGLSKVWKVSLGVLVTYVDKKKTLPSDQEAVHARTHDVTFCLICCTYLKLLILIKFVPETTHETNISRNHASENERSVPCPWKPYHPRNSESSVGRCQKKDPVVLSFLTFNHHHGGK